jgi:nucleoside-diphosphate-sugar epimerase
MRLLFLGGTGLISSACSDLAVARGHELFIVTRGHSSKYQIPGEAILLRADVREDALLADASLKRLHFDAVVDFLAFSERDLEHHLELVGRRTDQYVLISSAAAYQKPPSHYRIREETPLENPYWDYARGKIACEQRLRHVARETGLPVTIVRPSLTYGPSQIPLCVGSWAHPWTVVDRVLRGRPLVVPGDGTSLWVLTWNADFARGLLGILGNPDALGQSFHITSDEVLTWDQIYAGLFDAVHRPPLLVHLPSEVIAAIWPHASGSLLGDKSYSLVFDNSRIRSVLPDFACQVTWHEGVRNAIAWHETHPQFQTVDREMDALMDRMVLAHDRLLKQI